MIVVVGLLVMQNAIGIAMASLLGLDPLMGLLAGSITLSGGHGTGAAWSKLSVSYTHLIRTRRLLNQLRSALAKSISPAI